MKKILVLVFFQVFVLLQLSAAVYSYRDEQGRLFLTDRPLNDKYKLVVTSRKSTVGPSDPEQQVSKSHSSFSTNGLIPADVAFAKDINDAAKEYDVDPCLIRSVIMVESSFNPDAVSTKGAQGLMQLMPTTAKMLGCKDAFNPRDNIMSGTNYLNMMFKRFNGNLDHALAAYNAGPGNVEKHGGIPPFRETENYVRKVKHYYLAANQEQLNSKSVQIASNKQRELVVLHPDLSDKLAEAYAKFEARQNAEAMKIYRNILNKYPKNTQALYNLACLLDIERQYEEAIDIYKAAIKEDPFLDKGYYNMAVIYERLGYHEEAVETWKNFISITGEEDKIQLAERYIKELREYAALNW